MDTTPTIELYGTVPDLTENPDDRYDVDDPF
jgi:hypothetical protein